MSGHPGPYHRPPARLSDASQRLVDDLVQTRGVAYAARELRVSPAVVERLVDGGYASTVAVEHVERVIERRKLWRLVG